MASTEPSLETRLSLLTAFAADLRALGPANFLYADGDAILPTATGACESPASVPTRLDNGCESDFALGPILRPTTAAAPRSLRKHDQ